MAKAKDSDLIIKRFLERKDIAEAATKANRLRSLAEMRFLRGGRHQWENSDGAAKEYDKRVAEGRPALTDNTLPKFVRQVTGDLLLNEVTIKVRPDDDEANQDVADAIAGKIKEIEYRSEANEVYTMAASHAAKCGWPGYFRIVTDYIDNTSFDQDAWIKPVINPFSVLVDPESVLPDASDAKWFAIINRMRRKAFESKYKGKKGNIDYFSDNDTSDDYIFYAEYWECSTVKGTIAKIQLADSVVVGKPEDYPEGEVTEEREIEEYKWTRYLLTDKNYLEDPKEYPGQLSPLIRVPGDDLIIDGETHYQGVITHAIGPAQFNNFIKSAIAEHVMLSPKAKYIGTEDQFRGHETEWDNSNTIATTRLTYTSDQKAPGAPIIVPPPQVPTGLVQMQQEGKQSLYDTTGIYPPSLGNTTRQESGKAINAQVKEGDISTYVYVSNRARAIQQCGRVLVDLLPRIIDNPRNIRTRKVDGTEQLVPMNQHVRKKQDGSYEPTSPEMPDAIDMTLKNGRYSVIIDSGPSYSTKREESAVALTEMMRAAGAEGIVIWPEVIKAQDFNDAEEISKVAEDALIKKGLRDPKPDGNGNIPQDTSQADAAQAAMQAEQQKFNADMAIKAEEFDIKRAELRIKDKEADIKLQESIFKHEEAMALQPNEEMLRQMIVQTVAEMLQPQADPMTQPEPMPMAQQMPENMPMEPMMGDIPEMGGYQ